MRSGLATTSASRPSSGRRSPPKPTARRPNSSTYYLWGVDPAVADLVHAQGFVTGHPVRQNIVDSAHSFQDVYGTVLNTDLCNWIADNVAAAAGATMPLPNQLLEPENNVEGGFWRIAYRSSDTDQPVADWNTLVKPGDIVRLQWAKTGAGHTTTVLAVNDDGSIDVYDNIDVIDGVHHIGEHDDVNYWRNTDPAGITIYRLDHDQQYLINGTSRAQSIQGSVFDDLVYARPGADTVSGSLGSDEIRGGRGADLLRGEAGDDVLVGGRGRDKLFGGDGANVFRYKSIRQSKPGAAHRDVIADFHGGRDRIDLSGIDARLDKKGDQPFHFIGQQTFGHEAGDLAYLKYATHLVVQGDTNGDGRADFQIWVDGASTLSAGDFDL